LSGRKINENMGHYISNLLLKKLKKNYLNISKIKIGIMGVTFKENCNDLRGSKVIDIIKDLKKSGAEVLVYDPIVKNREFNKYIPDIKIKKISKKVDALIIAVSHKEFLKLKISDLKNILRSKNSILMDVKSIFRDDKIKNSFDYWSL
jgi:UDP-N-acetyl-D-galactosamine dehydrogenase